MQLLESEPRRYVESTRYDGIRRAEKGELKCVCLPIEKLVLLTRRKVSRALLSAEPFMPAPVLH
jgi:hypothetical protein